MALAQPRPLPSFRPGLSRTFTRVRHDGLGAERPSLKPDCVFPRACCPSPRLRPMGPKGPERPPQNEERPHLPNSTESPIPQARLQPASDPMKFLSAAFVSTLALAALAWLGDGTAAFASPKSIPVPKPRPTLVARGESALVTPVALHSKLPPPAPTAPSADLGTVKQALELIRRGKTGEATSLEAGMRDAAAKKLVEWAILRNDENGVGFDRYVAFISANPGWPSVGMLRRRAEGALLQEGRSPATVLAFFAKTQPLTPRGRFALARALLAQGDRAAAQFYVREAWRYDAFGEELETQALDAFRDLITRADHGARMDDRLSAQDREGGLRPARRLGPAEMAIAKARAAVIGKAANAGQLLDAVPE